jgi:phage-related protein
VNPFQISFFEEAKIFIREQTETERAKIASNITKMTTDFDSVETKVLRGSVRELKVGKARLLFFIKKNIIYFVSGFTKKTQKTPIKEIEKAEAVYKKI